SGNGRIAFRRDVNWEYFYDDFGGPLIRLYRILGRLRRTYPPYVAVNPFTTTSTRARATDCWPIGVGPPPASSSRSGSWTFRTTVPHSAFRSGRPEATWSSSTRTSDRCWAHLPGKSR